MYLIIEKSCNRIYAYREDAAQFENLEQVYRYTFEKLAAEKLDDECDLSDMPNNAYIVFKLAPVKAKKKPAKKPTKKAKKKKRAT